MRSVHAILFISVAAVAGACASETSDTANPPTVSAAGGSGGSVESGGSAGSVWDPPGGGSAGQAGEPTSGGGASGAGAGSGASGGAAGGPGIPFDGGIGIPKDGGIGIPKDGGGPGTVLVKLVTGTTSLSCNVLGVMSSSDYSVEYTNEMSTGQTVVTKSAKITFSLPSSSMTLPMFVSPTSHNIKAGTTKLEQYTGTTLLSSSLSCNYCNGTAKIEVEFEREDGSIATRALGPYQIDCP